MLALLIIIGALVWLNAGSRETPQSASSSNSRKEQSNLSVNQPVMTAANANQTPHMVPASPASPVDLSEEIKDLVLSWSRANEARDLDRTMSFYADSLRYFRMPAASKAFARTDKQRYFNKYPTASVSISNMQVTPMSDDTTDVQFDKEWVYGGGGSGKVRDELRFRKIGGRWLIVSERDIKEYYVNK